MLTRPPAEWLSRKSGQNFVAIHGLAMAPVFWRLYAPSEVFQHNTVAYPLPGHHPWPLTPEALPLTTGAIVDAYATAIEQDFSGRPVTLVGHSTGGFISLLLAAHRPDLVRAVVLMGAFACGRFEGRERVAARLLRMPRIGPQLFVYLFRRWISTSEQFRWGSIDCVYDKTCPWENPEAIAMMEDVRLHLQRARPEDIGALVAWIQQNSHIAEISRIEAPVLNMVGARDAIVPPSHQLRLSRLLPNVQTVLFGKAGHLVMVEQQAEVDRLFSRFIRNPFVGMRSMAAPTRALGTTKPDLNQIKTVADQTRLAGLKASLSRRWNKIAGLAFLVRQ